MEAGIESFRFYPNPVIDLLNLEFVTSHTRKLQVSVLDASGKVMLSRKFRPAGSLVKESMDLSKLVGGVYFLRIGDEGEVMKIVKE
jgi:hypothetical protein